MAFTFYGRSSIRKDKEKEKRKKKQQETMPIFEVTYLRNALAISLKFGMWSTEVGGRVHSKIRLVS